MESTLRRQTDSLSKIDMLSPETVQLLSTLPSIINQYPLPSDLRSILKRKSHYFYRSLIEQLQPISEQCAALQTQNSLILNRLSALQQEVGASLSLTNQALRSGSRLSHELARVSQKKQILQSLLGRLKLRQSEQAILKESPVGLSSDFFVVLNKLNSISDCALLLDTHDARVLKMSVDDYVSSYQEIAYQKLFRFVQEQCKMLQHDKVELLHGFYEAISHLKQRPIYYSHCREELIRSRQRLFLRIFRATLAQGEEALEKHITKPVLFVGECLAWIQSSVLNEKQLIEGLLGVVETLQSEGDNIQESTVIDKITDNSSLDLKDYIEIAAKNCSMIDSFQVLVLMAYYVKVFTEGGLLSFASKIVQVLYRSSSITEERLNSTLDAAVGQIKLFSISTDLRVPRAFQENFRDLLVILGLIQNNPQFLPFYRILYDAMIQKTLQFYKAEAQAALEKDRECILLINFLMYVKFSLGEFEFSAGDIDRIEFEIGSYKEDLVAAVVEEVVRTHNLTVSHLPRSLHSFYSDLYTAGGLELAVLSAIQNENVKRSVQTEISRELLEVYRGLKEKTSEAVPDIEKVELILKCQLNS